MASAPAGLALLERAVGYALAQAVDVTPVQLAYPTPCAGWDLRTLLAHIGDSARALREAIGSGRVCWVAGPAAEPGDIAPGRRPHPAAAFCAEAGLLLGACAVDRTEHHVAIGDRRLTVGLVATTGAIELAVHGWDISAACGRSRPIRPIPPELALDLLEVAFLVVNGTTRPGLFAEPLMGTPVACPGDKLVALLGRTPPA